VVVGVRVGGQSPYSDPRATGVRVRTLTPDSDPNAGRNERLRSGVN